VNTAVTPNRLSSGLSIPYHLHHPEPLGVLGAEASVICQGEERLREGELVKAHPTLHPRPFEVDDGLVPLRDINVRINRVKRQETFLKGRHSAASFSFLDTLPLAF